MKKFGILLAAALALMACKKDITLGSVVGTWSESYDPKVFAMDGFLKYTFDVENNYRLLVYDALSGVEKEFRGSYTLDLDGANTITLGPAQEVGASDTDSSASGQGGSVCYKIVKLTSKEMAWQKEGTTYSPGTWGSDYRHFEKAQ